MLKNTTIHFLAICLFAVFSIAAGAPDKIVQEATLAPADPEVRMSRDFRPLFVETLLRALNNDNIKTKIVKSGIDINFGVDKRHAAEDYFARDPSIDPNASFYFGDGFKKDDNDTPIAELKRDGGPQYQNFQILSVDDDAPDATIRDAVTHLGGGPAKTMEVLQQILDAVTGAREFPSDSPINIDIEKLKNQEGALLFDVGGTLFDFQKHPEFTQIMKGLLDNNINIAIISGKSFAELEEGMLAPLRDADASFDSFSLYSNAGATLSTFEGRGDAVTPTTVKTIDGLITREEVATIQKTLQEFLIGHSSELSEEEIAALESYYEALEKEKFPDGMDRSWLDSNPGWSADKLISSRKERRRTLSGPALEVRETEEDTVAVAVLKLPGSLPLPPDRSEETARLNRFLENIFYRLLQLDNGTYQSFVSSLGIATDERGEWDDFLMKKTNNIFNFARRQQYVWEGKLFPAVKERYDALFRVYANEVRGGRLPDEGIQNEKDLYYHFINATEAKYQQLVYVLSPLFPDQTLSVLDSDQTRELIEPDPFFFRLIRHQDASASSEVERPKKHRHPDFRDFVAAGKRTDKGHSLALLQRIVFDYWELLPTSVREGLNAENLRGISGFEPPQKNTSRTLKVGEAVSIENNQINGIPIDTGTLEHLRHQYYRENKSLISTVRFQIQGKMIRVEMGIDLALIGAGPLEWKLLGLHERNPKAPDLQDRWLKLILVEAPEAIRDVKIRGLEIANSDETFVLSLDRMHFIGYRYSSGEKQFTSIVSIEKGRDIFIFEMDTVGIEDRNFHNMMQALEAGTARGWLPGHVSRVYTDQTINEIDFSRTPFPVDSFLRSG